MSRDYTTLDNNDVTCLQTRSRTVHVLIYSCKNVFFIFPMGWYAVCEIDFTNRKNRGNPNLVCKKIITNIRALTHFYRLMIIKDSSRMGKIRVKKHAKLHSWA